MRLLLYEHLTACNDQGRLGGSESASLHREGWGMLQALVEDFSRIEGLEISVPCSESQGATFSGRVRSLRTPGGVSPLRLLAEWTTDITAALVVAPELDGILEDLTTGLESLGVRNLGSESSGVRIAGDKYLTAKTLAQRGVPMISTEEFTGSCFDESAEWERLQAEFRHEPVVLKPRWGAGSQETLYFSSLPERDVLHSLIHESQWLRNSILQPYVAGDSLSVGVWCAGNGNDFNVLPVCDQLFSNPTSFEYLGGVVPSGRWIDSPALQLAVQKIARDACRAVPGLRGYVGVDLILPREEDGEPSTPLVCEINPRLTTSYLGYRRLSLTNLAEQWLTYSPARIQLQEFQVDYRTDGTTRVLR